MSISVHKIGRGIDAPVSRADCTVMRVVQFCVRSAYRSAGVLIRRAWAVLGKRDFGVTPFRSSVVPCMDPISSFALVHLVVAQGRRLTCFREEIAQEEDVEHAEEGVRMTVDKKVWKGPPITCVDMHSLVTPAGSRDVMLIGTEEGLYSMFSDTQEPEKMASFGNARITAVSFTRAPIDGSFAIVVTDNRSVYCWGMSLHQFGVPFVQKEAIQREPFFDGMHHIEAVAQTVHARCVLADGKVYCWGRNVFFNDLRFVCGSYVSLWCERLLNYRMFQSMEDPLFKLSFFSNSVFQPKQVAALNSERVTAISLNTPPFSCSSILFAGTEKGNVYSVQKPGRYSVSILDKDRLRIGSFPGRSVKQIVYSQSWDDRVVSVLLSDETVHMSILNVLLAQDFLDYSPFKEISSLSKKGVVSLGSSGVSFMSAVTRDGSVCFFDIPNGSQSGVIPLRWSQKPEIFFPYRYQTESALIGAEWAGEDPKWDAVTLVGSLMYSWCYPIRWCVDNILCDVLSFWPDFRPYRSNVS